MLDDLSTAASGDPDAFARLVDLHRDAVCAITFAITRDHAASEDAAQDAFVAAWRALPGLRDRRRFRTWLHQIARNQARMHLRSAAVRRRADDDGSIGSVVAAEPSPEHALAAEEDADVVRRALADLDPSHREVLVLYYREDRSVSEVARELELTEGTARKRLERARTALRTELEPRLAAHLRSTRPTATLTAAILAVVALWPRSAAAAPATSPRTWLVAAAGAVLGAVAVVGLPLLASPGSVPVTPLEPVRLATPAATDPAPEELAPPPPAEPPAPAEPEHPPAREPDAEPPPAPVVETVHAATEASPAPPEPAAPAAAPATVRVDHDTRVTFRSTGDGAQLSAVIVGAVEFDAGLSRVVAASGTLTIEQHGSGQARRVVVTGDGSGGLVEGLWVGRREVPFDDTARAWLASVLPRVMADVKPIPLPGL